MEKYLTGTVPEAFLPVPSQVTIFRNYLPLGLLYTLARDGQERFRYRSYEVFPQAMEKSALTKCYVTSAHRVFAILFFLFWLFGVPGTTFSFT